MVGLPPAIQALWALIVIVQIIVCWFLFYKGHFRKLPFFTFYIVVHIAQSVLIYTLYHRLGSAAYGRSSLYWPLQLSVIFVRALAVVELCRQVLRPYPGVWVLTRRGFGIVSIAGLLFTAIEVKIDPAWAIAVANRGVNLTLLLCLLVFIVLNLEYYIPVHRSYAALIGGFCFYSLVVVMIETFAPSISITTYHAIILLCYALVIIAWAAALRRPLPPSPRVLSLSVRPATPQSQPVRYGLRRVVCIFARIVLHRHIEPW